METPKAPEIIQVMASVFPKAVHAAMVAEPKELMPDCTSTLERSKVTSDRPAGTPMPRIRRSSVGSIRSAENRRGHSFERTSVIISSPALMA